MDFFKKSHRGISSLVLIFTLMLLSTLFILFAAQFSILQQKITANLYRNQQAFEAAQAGLEASIPYLEANYSTIVAAASGGYLTPYVNSNTQNVALANGSQYSFVFSNPTANNFQLITVTSTGTTADGTSTRVVTQRIKSYSSSIPVPTVTLGSQDDVSVGNTAVISNTFTNSNIIAGGSVSFSSSGHTTTSSGTTSSTSGLGSDVTQNNSALSSLSSGTYFRNVFGVSSSSLRSIANYTYSFLVDHTYNANLNGLTGSIIWIDQFFGTATINSTTVIGSIAQPVILVVNGNLLISDSAVINGFIFILNPSNAVVIRSSAILNGAIATSGDLSFQGGAALNYNSAILYALPSVGGTTHYAKVPGSWRDF
jgi:Tfp pilus assembly protein PilX